MRLLIVKNYFQSGRLKSLSIVDETLPKVVIQTFRINVKCRSNYCAIKALNEMTRALIIYVRHQLTDAHLDLDGLYDLLAQDGNILDAGK